MDPASAPDAQSCTHHTSLDSLVGAHCGICNRIKLEPGEAEMVFSPDRKAIGSADDRFCGIRATRD